MCAPNIGLHDLSASSPAQMRPVSLAHVVADSKAAVSLPASGKGEEQSLAATVLTLLCLQMGSGPEGEEVFRSLKPLLITILTDSSASPVARQSVSSIFFPLLSPSLSLSPFFVFLALKFILTLTRALVGGSC